MRKHNGRMILILTSKQEVSHSLYTYTTFCVVNLVNEAKQ